MKPEFFGELRYVACKNGDCAESIPLPSQSLLEPSAYQLTTGVALPPIYLACMRCDHVYGYTPLEVQYLGAGGTLGLDPETALHHRAVELLCAPDCKGPETIHVPTYIDGDEDALRAHVSRLKLFEVFCRHGKKIEKVLLHSYMPRYD